MIRLPPETTLPSSIFPYTTLFRPPSPPAMPIYAYRCAACEHDFDRPQKLSDPDPDACPSCGAAGQVRRQVTAPSFRLAGSGWYETDFKKDGEDRKSTRLNSSH